jgi:Protein of unknown function (DUF742)
VTSTGTVDSTWLDRDAGPVVRPYAMTSGRTRPVRGSFDLISMILATAPAGVSADLGPEAISIIRLCRTPLSVAEIAAHLDLPSGTVKVILGDLLGREMIRASSPMPGAEASAEPVLEAVMHALRSL